MRGREREEEEFNPHYHRPPRIRHNIDFGPPISPVRGRHAKLNWAGGYEEVLVPSDYPARHRKVTV